MTDTKLVQQYKYNKHNIHKTPFTS